MTEDLEAVSPSAVRRAMPQTGTHLVRCGEELVDLVEAYYVRLFAVAMNCWLGTVAVAFAVTPVDAGRSNLTGRLVALTTIACCAALGRRRSRETYRALRSHPAALVVAVTVIAVTLVADDPANSPMWLVAFGAIGLSAIAGDSRLTAVCACVLTCGYVLGVASHGGLQGLFDGPRAAVPAASFGLSALLFHGMIDGTAAFVLRLGQGVAMTSSPPRPVTAWSEPVATPRSRFGTLTLGPSPLHVDPTLELTARQLEVVALLCEGFKQYEIAERLAISVRQVRRHVRDAKDRVSARSTAELVVTALAAGLVRGVEHGRV